MKRITTNYILPAVALVVFGAVLGTQLDTYLSDDNALQQFKKLRRAFLVINQEYVDSLDAAHLAEEGVKGMVNSLDPHSTYIPSEQVKDVQDQYQGSFGGIGILFEMQQDTARVISPVADGPSENVGVMAGDRIVQIEDASAVGITSSEIQDRLKGKIGTEVQMTVYRPVTDKRISFTITRDEIPLYSIRSSYMVDDRTGYIKIDRFAMTTPKEFREKAKALREQGMERLILDLRSNPGGVKNASAKIADEMLGDGMTIVSMRGRTSEMNSQFEARPGGMLEEDPVIVLVNSQSASASEIVAGALQDHDRALLVGRRTFGKALVQKQFELTDESVLQMTVGRFYTPVGRLIQTPYEKGNPESYSEEKYANYHDATFNVHSYKKNIPDSLAYQTDHGRTVFGGGGILPDYVVPPDTSSLTHFVRSSGLDFAFARQWFSNHETEFRDAWQDRQEEFRASYEVSDEMVSSFWDHAEEENMTLTTDSEKVNPKQRVYSQQAARTAHDFVAARIKGFLARQLYGSGAARPILNETDPVFQKAMSLWPSSQELASYHTQTSSAPMEN